jgi:hypothetical protein
VDWHDGWASEFSTRMPSLIIDVLGDEAHAARHQLERSLFARGVLEGAPHLIPATGVAALLILMLAHGTERHPLCAGALPVVSPTAPRPRKMASTCSIARSRLVRACGPVSSSIVVDPILVR